MNQDTPTPPPEQPQTGAVKSLTEIIKTAETVRRMEKGLEGELAKLRREKKPGTVIIFDLKGSTKYRRRYGPELGLHKAYLHNSTVSEAIVAAGGRVAKWLGDGVLGYFAGGDDRHAFLALRAALAALADLRALNQLDPLEGVVKAEKRGEYVKIDHDIHTKVSICSGELHFFPSGATGPGRAAQDDPMGSCVDLASRLNDLAEADVILIDRATFWRTAALPTRPTADLGPGICRVPKKEVRWRPLLLPAVRTTVYVPHVSAFLVEDEWMSPCRAAQAGQDAIGADELVEFATFDREKDKLPDAPIVYVLHPVPCNVPGFEDPVEVVALTLHPNPAPIAVSIHDWDDPHIQQLLAEAERLYRSGGKQAEAKLKYEEVLAADPRNFRANVRLAMLARGDGDSKKAMFYLMAAKHSNPTCPLAWAVAAMSHLEDFLDDRNLGEALTRAVTGFTRAKVLSAEGFHGLLEQYSTALLAIAYLLTEDDDTAALTGKVLIDELASWPPKNATSRCATRLAGVFHRIRFRDSTAQAEVDRLLFEINNDPHLKLDTVEAIPYDHVIRYEDVLNLLGRAECKAKRVRPTPRAAGG